MTKSFLQQICQRKSFLKVRPKMATVLAFSLIFAMCLFNTSNHDASAATINVDGSCTETNSGTHLCNGTTYHTMQGAINAASSGDTINVAAGTYTENLIITKAVTLLGPNADVDPNTGTRVAEAIFDGGSGTTIIPQTNGIVINGFTVSTSASGFPIYTSGTDITGLTISNDIVGSGVRAITIATNGDSISILHNQVSGAAYGIHFGSGTYSNVKINNNRVNGPVTTYAIFINGGGTINGFELKDNMVHDIANIAANISNGVVSGNTFDAPASSGLDIQINLHNSIISSNTFQGQGTVACLQLFGSQYGLVPSNTVTISGNTFNHCGASGPSWTFAIQLSPDIDHITITNNIISNAYDGINTRTVTSWDLTGKDIHINSNSITDSTHYGVNNAETGTLDATKNWWGSTDSITIASKISGIVTFDPWYINPGMTTLSTSTSGSTITSTTGDLDFTSSATGQADLPSGINAVVLSDNTALNFTKSLNTASGGNIVVGGSTIGLSTYTSGTLSSVDLSVPQNVGDQHVSIDKAVKISSGQSGTAVTITNTALPNISASIPDGTTILAPSGWDGKMTPPKIGSSSGTAPSGFSIGNTIIEVGSPDVVLLFDKPVTLLLSGVTGNVAYRSSGSSTWISITNTCGGTYASPSNPAFPGECFISNGVDTKIVTYHFTTFGSLITSAGPHGETRVLPPSFLGSDISNIRINDGFTLAGDSYTVSRYAMDIPTHRLVLNEPYMITLKAYDTSRGGGIANIGIYFGPHPMINLLDTKFSIDWDKDVGVKVQDPSGYIKNATVMRTFAPNENIFSFTFTPTKPMPTSDIYARIWNAKLAATERVMLKAVQFSGEFLSYSEAEMPSTIKIYDNAVDLGRQLDIDGFSHPLILSKITSKTSVFQNISGKVLFFYDTQNKVISRVLMDENGKVIDINFESLTAILPTPTSPYTHLGLNRNNPTELESAQAAEEVKAMKLLIRMYGMDYVVQYHMLG